MIEVGVIVSTHGIKGEIKIISSFPLKEQAFKIGSSVWIDQVSYLITSYRRHKNYDMITLEGLKEINQVMPLMKRKVYKAKSELDLTNTILDQELIDMIVEDEKEHLLGKVIEVFNASKTNKLIRVQGEKEFLLPYREEFVRSIDKEKRKIVVCLIEGMIE